MTAPKPEGWGKARKRTRKELNAANKAAIEAREFFERMLFGGKLRKDAREGIDFEPPGLRELKIENALRLDEDFGFDQAKYDAFHTRAEAGAEQRMLALRDAERYGGFYTGTRQRWPGLGGYSAVVRAMAEGVMTDHRDIPSEYLDYSEVAIVGSRLRAVPFDVDNPEHYRGVFGLVAGLPQTVHVLRSGENVELWLEAQVRYRTRKCRWSSHACMSYTAGQLLLITRGQYLVAVPTCYTCAQELTRDFTAGSLSG